MPKRIQRKRTKGWKMPPNTLYVGRPTKWGNSYVIDSEDERAEAVESFEIEIASKIRRGLDLSSLRGKDLACFCPLDKPCHADVLLRLANAQAIAQVVDKIQKKEDVVKEARTLVAQTVQDMQSSLGCNEYSIEVLSWAQHIAVRRGEKTKAVILKRTLKKMENNLVAEPTK